MGTLSTCSAYNYFSEITVGDVLDGSDYSCGLL